jgi:cell division protein FtsQ
VTVAADRFFRPVDRKATPRNRRRLQAQRILVTAANVLFVAMIALGGFWLWERTQNDRRFAISSIDVSGLTHADAAAVESILAGFSGKNLFSLDLAVVRGKLREVPWIADAALEKKLPGELFVRVIERIPVALASAEGRLLYVDATGTPFAPLAPEAGNAELPIIHATPGVELRRAVAFLERLRVTAPAAWGRVSEVTPVAPDGYLVFDRLLRTGVLLSERDATSKWDELYRIAAAEGFAAGSLEYADLRFAGRIVVKPRSDTVRKTPSSRSGGETRAGA